MENTAAHFCAVFLRTACRSTSCWTKIGGAYHLSGGLAHQSLPSTYCRSTTVLIPTKFPPCPAAHPAPLQHLTISGPLLRTLTCTFPFRLFSLAFRARHVQKGAFKAQVACFLTSLDQLFAGQAPSFKAWIPVLQHFGSKSYPCCPANL